MNRSCVLISALMMSIFTWHYAEGKSWFDSLARCFCSGNKVSISNISIDGDGLVVTSGGIRIGKNGIETDFPIIEGSGVRARVESSVDCYDKIAIAHPIDVVLMPLPQADKAHHTFRETMRISIEGDDNIVPQVHTRLQHGKLTLYFAEGAYKKAQPLLVTCFVKCLNEIEISSGTLNMKKDAWRDVLLTTDTMKIKAHGTAKIGLRNLDTQVIHADVTDTAKVTCQGKTHEVTLHIRDVGYFNANKLRVAHRLTINGEGITSKAKFGMLDLKELQITTAGTKMWLQGKVSEAIVNGKTDIDAENLAIDASLKATLHKLSTAVFWLLAAERTYIEADSSRVICKGNVIDQKIYSKGHSKINASQLQTQITYAEASGTSSVSVNVTKKLEGTASNVAHITYTGDPKEVIKHESDLGRVRPV